MKVSKLLTLAAVPLVMAACRTDRDDVDDTWTDPGLTTTPATTDATEAREQTVNLDEVAGSGMGGEVRMRQVGGQTEVTVRVENAGPNQTLHGGVHSGTCAMPGEQVAALPQITTDQAGNGQAMGTVNIPGWGTAAGTTGTATPGTAGTGTAGTGTAGTGTTAQPGVTGTGAQNQYVIAYRTSQDQSAAPVVCGELRHDGGTTGW
jgi:hypothetical protein